MCLHIHERTYGVTYNLLTFRNKHRKIKLASIITRVQYISGLGDFKFSYYNGDKLLLEDFGNINIDKSTYLFDLLTKKIFNKAAYLKFKYYSENLLAEAYFCKRPNNYLPLGKTILVYDSFFFGTIRIIPISQYYSKYCKSFNYTHFKYVYNNIKIKFFLFRKRKNYRYFFVKNQNKFKENNKNQRAQNTYKQNQKITFKETSDNPLRTTKAFMHTQNKYKRSVRSLTVTKKRGPTSENKFVALLGLRDTTKLKDNKLNKAYPRKNKKKRNKLFLKKLMRSVPYFPTLTNKIKFTINLIFKYKAFFAVKTLADFSSIYKHLKIMHLRYNTKSKLIYKIRILNFRNFSKFSIQRLLQRKLYYEKKVTKILRLFRRANFRLRYKRQRKLYYASKFGFKHLRRHYSKNKFKKFSHFKKFIKAQIKKFKKHRLQFLAYRRLQIKRLYSSIIKDMLYNKTHTFIIFKHVFFLNKQLHNTKPFLKLRKKLDIYQENFGVKKKIKNNIFSPYTSKTALKHEFKNRAKIYFTISWAFSMFIRKKEEIKDFILENCENEKFNDKAFVG